MMYSVVKKLFCVVRVVSVNQESSVASLSFLLCLLVEVLNDVYTNLTIDPAFFRVTNPRMWSERIDP
jgi:hypothetical protein